MSSTTHLETVIRGLDSIGKLESKVTAFGKAFDAAIFSQYIKALPNGTTRTVAIMSNTIQVTEHGPASSTANLLDVVDEILKFLSLHLPDTVHDPLWEALLPKLISRLLSGPLASAVPPDLKASQLSKLR